MGGHIDMFRWSAVEGADGYVIRIVAVTGNRVVWESEPMTATETKLPADRRARAGSAHVERHRAEGRHGAGDIGHTAVHHHAIGRRFTPATDSHWPQIHTDLDTD